MLSKELVDFDAETSLIIDEKKNYTRKRSVIMSGTSDGSQRQRPQRLDSLKGPLSRPPPAAQRLQVAEQAKKAPSKICPNPDCQSTNVGEEDGNVICHECGTVVSESVIVTDEVQFAETSNGGHATVGSYIGAGQAYASGGMAGLRSANPDARAATEATGRHSCSLCVHPLTSV